MTTSLRKSCFFGLLCADFENVYQILCVSFFPFWFEGGMWDVIALIPDQSFTIYLTDLLSFFSYMSICLPL